MTRAAAVFAGVLAGLQAAAPSGAHVVYGRVSLFELAAGADVVARARIVEPAEPVVGGAEGERRPAVTAELLEIYKGEISPGPVRFAQHGHGVAVYESGEEVLVFFRAIERSRELAALAATGLRYVSLQEHDAKLGLDAGSRSALVEAVRGYVALDSVPEGEERAEAFRELTFRLLSAPDERLAASALRDLVARGEALVTPESVPRIERLVDDPSVAIGIRVGVLVELDRLGRIEGEPRWVRLLRSAGGSDLLAVVRAAGAHLAPAVNEELIRLLGAGDREVAPAAALALGAPGNLAAVAALARVLEEGDHATMMAAIRALGAIAVPAAVASLEQTAESHPEELIRHRARAELRRLAGQRR